MSRHRHEIPTHLNVEDKAFYGFSARQIMYVTVGLSGSYALWNQWPGIPVPFRLTLIGLCLVLTLILTLVRPHGRSLDEWAVVALHYRAIPRISIWRPHAPVPPDRSSTTGDWEELTPRIDWREEPR